eukprot:TRINITY_DN12828_c0_g1_i2.p1 TRINITY_DN12828_c0_g1~~TRINITY_DN12828_c0_g1_i2.p1  ORF type:complete len:269 (+),score=23.98 TRINITY_DN12828_c0_g1_i2:185-991(+)
MTCRCPEQMQAGDLGPRAPALRLPDVTDHQPVERVDILPDFLPPGSMFCLYNLLSPTECAHLIEWGATEGYEYLNLGYRTCYRAQVDAPDMAERLFDRIKPFLEGNYTLERTPGQKHKYSGKAHAGGQEQLGVACDEMLPGVWHPVAVNERFRLIEYHVGGSFLPHFDFGYTESTNKTTVQTVMFYLDESEGAETVVYNDQQVQYEQPQEANVLARIEPRVGMAMVFNARITHGGDPVREGHQKHILRTEIVYERDAKLHERHTRITR